MQFAKRVNQLQLWAISNHWHHLKALKSHEWMMLLCFMNSILESRAWFSPKKKNSQLFHFWHTYFQIGCFDEFLCRFWQLWQLETLRFSSTLSCRCTSWFCFGTVVLILHLLIHDSFIMSHVWHLVDMDESWHDLCIHRVMTQSSLQTT